MKFKLKNSIRWFVSSLKYIDSKFCNLNSNFITALCIIEIKLQIIKFKRKNKSETKPKKYIPR